MHLSLRQTGRNDWKLFVKRSEVGTYNRPENKHRAALQSKTNFNWQPQYLKELYNVLHILSRSIFLKMAAHNKKVIFWNWKHSVLWKDLSQHHSHVAIWFVLFFFVVLAALFANKDFIHKIAHASWSNGTKIDLFYYLYYKNLTEMVIMQFLLCYSGDTQESTSNVKLMIEHQHTFTALSKKCLGRWGSGQIKTEPLYFHLQSVDDLKQRHVLAEAGNRVEQMALSCCHSWQTTRGYCTSGVHMQQLYCGDTVRTISRGDGVALCWVCVFTFSCQRSSAVAGWLCQRRGQIVL